VIGFLRFIGIMNAAVWLGTAIFMTFGAGPACFSMGMKAALGLNEADSYYSNTIAQVVLTRYYHITLACGVVALLHLLAEWLYQGRPGRKFSLILLLGLFGWTLIGSNAVQPARVRALTRLNPQHYAATLPADRQSATRSLRVLRAVERVFNVLTIIGLVIYTWRLANPSDNLRFVRPVQFRG